MTVPPEIREFDEKIANARKEKESAIDGQDFEKAASLRDKEKNLITEKAEREKNWKAGDLDVVAEVDEELIAEVLSTATGIPVFKLTEAETARLLKMEDELHRRVIGQDQAIKALSQAIRRTRAGLKDPKRPGGSFIFAGPSGVGKTWILTALGASAVKSGLSVVHYTMELSEHYVGARYDTVFTHIPSADLRDRKEEVKAKIKGLKGKLLIKYYPPKGVSVKKLQMHIEKMIATGNRPDLIIVDYADLLLSHSNKTDSTYAEQGGVYIDLRGMGGELRIPIWTASQTNRSAIDSDVIEADKIADSYAKVMNADFIMSWSRKSKDKLNNTARAHIMKNRFGPDGITFPCKMDTNTGFIEVYDAASADGIIASKESNNGQMVQKQLLHKKYVENMG